MDPINNISSIKNNVNFKAQEDEEQVVKEEQPKKDNSGAIIGSLLALGAIGAGVLLAVKKGKKLPTKDAEKIIKGVTENPPAERQVVQAVNNAVVKPAAKVVERQATQVTREAVVKPGETYQAAKEAATHNLNHADKKIVKEKFRIVRDHDLEKAAEKQGKIVDAVKQTDVADRIANQSQQIRNAKTQENLSRIVDSAEQNASAARENASNARKLSDEIGTKRSSRIARVAENRATEAELQAKKTQEKAVRKAEDIAAEQERKAAARALQPPKTEAQIQKEAENINAQNENAIQRKATRDAAKPKNQRLSTVDTATQRIVPGFSKKYPNTDEGNIALLDILKTSTEQPKRKAAEAILSSRGII